MSQLLDVSLFPERVCYPLSPWERDWGEGPEGRVSRGLVYYSVRAENYWAAVENREGGFLQCALFLMGS